MTSEPRPGANGTVELTVPAEPAYVLVLRTVTSSLAARHDFTLDEIDDLRIAVDEASALLLPHAVTGSQLRAVFDGAAAGLRIEVSVRVPADLTVQPDRSSFGWLLLTALTDSAVLSPADQRLAVTLTKARAARHT